MTHYNHLIFIPVLLEKQFLYTISASSLLRVIDTDDFPDMKRSPEKVSFLLTFIKTVSGGDKTLNSLFPTGYHRELLNTGDTHLEIKTCMFECVCMCLCEGIKTLLYFLTRLEILTPIGPDSSTGQGGRLR